MTAAVLDAGSVADIAVEDPPLEEVIARIYGERRKEVSIMKSAYKISLDWLHGRAVELAYRRSDLPKFVSRDDSLHLHAAVERRLCRSGKDRIAGLTLPQMLWYLVITEAIYMSAPRVWAEVDQDVRTGRLAVHLITPVVVCRQDILAARWASGGPIRDQPDGWRVSSHWSWWGRYK